DEVEKQLRSVKLQAAKAQRYQEYSTRLKELRIGLGLQEFEQLAERLQVETQVLEGLRADLEEKAKQAESWQTDIRSLEEVLARRDEGLDDEDGGLGQAREQIATHDATLTHEWSLSQQLEADLARMQARVTELNSLVASLAETATEAGQELRGVDGQCQEQRHGLAQYEQEHHAAVQRLAELHAQVQSDKAEHLEQMRHAAHLQNDVVSFKAQVDQLWRERERLRLKTD